MAEVPLLGDHEGRRVRSSTMDAMTPELREAENSKQNESQRAGCWLEERHPVQAVGKAEPGALAWLGR